MSLAFPFEYRAPVTVEYFYNTLMVLDADIPFFTYDREADEFGLDPWRLKDGMDRTVKPDDMGYQYFFGAGTKPHRGRETVYVQVRDLDRLGVPWVQSIEWQTRRQAQVVL